MANGFPYWQFHSERWLIGKISSFSLEEQALFLNLCITAWINQGVFNMCSTLVARKFNKSVEWVENCVDSFEKCGILQRNDDGTHSIKFISEQLEEMESVREKRSIAGRISADSKKKKEKVAKRIDKDKISKGKVSSVLNTCSTPVQHVLNSETFVSHAKEINGNRLDGIQLKAFCDYWTEAGKSGKMRFECEKFFDMSRRIATWQRNNSKFEKPAFGNSMRKFDSPAPDIAAEERRRKEAAEAFERNRQLGLDLSEKQ